MPPREDLSTDDTPPTIHEQLSTLIVISTVNLHRLDAIITQMTTINTLMIGIQTETMAKIMSPLPSLPPQNQQRRPSPPRLPTTLSTLPLPPPHRSLSPPPSPPPKPLQLPVSTQHPLPPLPQPPPSKVTSRQFRPVTFQPFNPQFPALVVVGTRMQDLEDKVHLKDGGIDTCLRSYSRPPPWPDPYKSCSRNLEHTLHEEDQVNKSSFLKLGLTHVSISIHVSLFLVSKLFPFPINDNHPWHEY
ncbi:unnamed protein product [Lactuca virosa]|uniref:Uncharacterized protein n=1 Tax=Lactuca virosa TaxID=75947 RepID=A0AAU9N434_9ASTR|nr:unnamed protein product [Lactuca virosa]